MFNNVFTKAYWASSFRKLKDTRYLAIIGLMIGLKFILNMFRLPVSENLNIMFSFIPTALEAAIIGPGAAMVSAVITDLVSATLTPFGPFFPGYMLSKVLSSLLFGLFLYQRELKFINVFIPKLLINYLVNVGLGSLWNSILYGKAFLVYASVSVVKNTVLLPIEVLLLYAFLRSIYPFLIRRGIMKTTD